VDVGHLEVGGALSAKFDPATGDLLTRGTAGLLRWPVRFEDGDVVRVGPPVRLLNERTYDWKLDVSGDGKVIAAAAGARALVLDRDEPNKAPVVLQPLRECRDLAVSPDGRFIAAGNHGGWPRDEVLKVFDARSGECVAKLPVGGWSQARFSPDGQWLFAKGDRVGFWRVGTWEEGPAAPSSKYHDQPAFEPGGRFVAYERGDGALLLIDPATGRTLAALENPDQGKSHFTSFTPDGATLVATNMDNPSLNVWDLRELRRHLAELELDWPGEPFPAADRAAPATGARRPLDVKVELGVAGQLSQNRQQARKLNEQAWRLVTGPADKHDPVKALPLIQKAVELSRNDPTYLNTLGVVLYRNGRPKEAAAALEKSLAAGEGQSDAFDLFFLAMCQAKQGDAAKARQSFERAKRWVGRQKNLPEQQAAELRDFEAEAEAELKKAEKGGK
jgi:hypothetical protein